MVNRLEIKAQMVRKGLKQKDLAIACGVSQPTISRLFRDGCCDIKLADKLIAVLEISNPVAVFFAP
jgi:predicted XRE-type DNA-binding protein